MITGVICGDQTIPSPTLSNKMVAHKLRKNALEATQIILCPYIFGEHGTVSKQLITSLDIEEPTLLVMFVKCHRLPQVKNFTPLTELLTVP